ncbi:MAG: type II toxin-antitoxin system RelE/ParE family toxin [Mesorhizobium sp.]|uniref:type II toxin-antitoxin system RelE/ParE family toxin n=1 Tax=Mesorhizobium sp. TaxID=1871066 RepID=UPI001ACE49C1|nr:type II toxin-antitoxin system RelE/ParE family toxin [Mesorhizobium sp.]
MSGESRECRFSPMAEADLEEIWLYTYRQWSLEQADRYQRDLIDTVEDLARGVKAGRRVDVRAGYFKYPVGQHFVFFRLSEKALDVIRVLHQRMDVERHL